MDQLELDHRLCTALELGKQKYFELNQCTAPPAAVGQEPVQNRTLIARPGPVPDAARGVWVHRDVEAQVETGRFQYIASRAERCLQLGLGIQPGARFPAER